MKEETAPEEEQPDSEEEQEDPAPEEEQETPAPEAEPEQPTGKESEAEPALLAAANGIAVHSGDTHTPHGICGDESCAAHGGKMGRGRPSARQTITSLWRTMATLRVLIIAI